MNDPITVYTTPWCGYCIRLKTQLKAHRIEFEEVDIEQHPEAAETVARINGGNQTVPTVLFPDGTALTNPSIRQIRDQLEPR